MCLLTKSDHVRSDADIAKAIGVPTDRVASIWQAHGGEAVRVHAPTSRSIRADALFTDAPGLTLTLRMADCQGFCVYDPVHHVAGLIHCGWRSVLARVIPHSIELMKREWSSDPTDLIVGAAPSLCKKCSEFTDPIKELPGFPRDLIEGRNADLQEAAERQFDACGVPRSSFERIHNCTRCHPETYWTYRGGHKKEVLDGLENALTCTLL